VKAAFAAYPGRVQARLLKVRDLIFKTAAEIEGVGPLKETLKWSEPAYLTEATGSGSTIRLGWFRSSERESAVLFNCRLRSSTTSACSFPTPSLTKKTGSSFSTCASGCQRRHSQFVSEWRSPTIGGARASSYVTRSS
jgi:hypothetical protein